MKGFAALVPEVQFLASKNQGCGEEETNNTQKSFGKRGLAHEVLNSECPKPALLPPPPPRGRVGCGPRHRPRKTLPHEVAPLHPTTGPGFSRARCPFKACQAVEKCPLDCCFPRPQPGFRSSSTRPEMVCSRLLKSWAIPDPCLRVDRPAGSRDRPRGRRPDGTSKRAPPPSGRPEFPGGWWGSPV